MTTERQRAANRRNGRQGRGPTTAEGKKTSSMNALKWGLSSPDGRALLPSESQEEFDEFADALLADRKPVGALEESLAMEVINCSWRLRRANNIELGILANGVMDADERHLNGIMPRLEAGVVALHSATGTWDPKKRVGVVDQGLSEQFLELMQESNRSRGTDAARLGAGFTEAADTLAKLGRYETPIFQRMIQALAALEALRAARLANTEEQA
jgi:hypothetical protein